MKLPEDKKERTKILVLIGIGAVVAVILLFQMPFIGILPLMKAKKAKLAKIEQLKTDVEKAEKEIHQLALDKAENRQVIEKIQDISEKHVLKPVLGLNYKLPASEIIDPIVKKLNVKLEQMRQIGVAVEANQTTLRSYSVRISLFCSYDDLVRFCREIEASNPLVSTINISVTAQGPESREKHMTSFEVQWPVWADTDMPDKLAKQLNDLSAGSGTK